MHVNLGNTCTHVGRNTNTCSWLALAKDRYQRVSFSACVCYGFKAQWKQAIHYLLTNQSFSGSSEWGLPWKSPSQLQTPYPVGKEFALQTDAWDTLTCLCFSWNTSHVFLYFTDNQIDPEWQLSYTEPSLVLDWTQRVERAAETDSLQVKLNPWLQDVYGSRREKWTSRCKQLLQVDVLLCLMSVWTLERNKTQ